ncbi:MAG: apolipoprotein N-acyltransferase [Treponema sp.]|jgi:apolipoprotein N-acyltransferase|nr:apolipoprotein N-acyltransferase [Treponema sp.]
MGKENGWVKLNLIHLGLVFSASILFALSFPNLLFRNGLPFLAWFSYIPILVLISRNSLLACAGWGAVYGYTAYALFNYWLGAFHPLAGAIVYTIYLFYMAVVFTLLKLAAVFFPKRSYPVQWIIWLAFEYLRTKGFLGYSYGITGYSQWRIIPLIQIAKITGVWGVSALVTFPSFWLAGTIIPYISRKGAKIAEIENQQTLNANKISKKIISSTLCSCRFGGIILQIKLIEKIIIIIWAAALCAALVFGFMTNTDFSSGPEVRIALIQHNTDPWLPSKAPTVRLANELYRKDLTILKNLSDEALSSEPKPQLVVWPETAFVPRIYWHTTYRDDPASWDMVRELLEYLSGKDVPFLIGNDDGLMDPAKNPNPNEKFRIDYNAALLFHKDKIIKTYRKLHLVPFTEHFPYKKQLPFIYNALKKADTHFWEKGDEETVFSVPGFTFSAPICFEDTFGYLSRNFVRRGADVLVNLSNDAWSNSLPAQNQHLSMAVFRSVENYRPMVRSTASGQTCAIDPNGKVTALASPFSETWINVTIPLVKGNTPYTLYGDYLALFFTLAAAALLIYGAICCTIKQNMGGRGNEYKEKDTNRR